MTPAAAKPEGYYSQDRRDVVAELPRPVGRALDVGCGAGRVGVALRDAGATEVVGVELVPIAAAQARDVLDTVIEAPVEQAILEGSLVGPFDTICCYDVLEHLVDPASVLSALREVAAPGGRLHVSVPNARHFSLVYDLVVRGTFAYTDFGHRDTTHLRWFTRSDIELEVARAGWTVQWTKAPVYRGRDRYVDRLLRGRADPFIALQWHLLAIAA